MIRDRNVSTFPYITQECFHNIHTDPKTQTIITFSTSGEQERNTRSSQIYEKSERFDDDEVHTSEIWISSSFSPHMQLSCQAWNSWLHVFPHQSRIRGAIWRDEDRSLADSSKLAVIWINKEKQITTTLTSSQMRMKIGGGFVCRHAVRILDNEMQATSHSRWKRLHFGT